ncbi:DUF397 domain-containing protein [Streptomyces gardneri]|uniref:DUF397 domain-containing protein n=1 Tax=Streptomyces gardneri TaxID=66892 RepID=UPI0035D772F0
MHSTTRTNEAADLTWKKSSYSGGAEGQCVEVAEAPAAVHIRDSKDQAGPSLTFTPAAFTQFASQV